MRGSTTPSWQGGPLRLPLHPPRRWRLIGIEPKRAIETSAVSSVQEASVLPETPRPSSCRWTARRAISLSRHPSIKEPSCSLNPSQGGYRAALDLLAGPGAFPLHRHRTTDSSSAVVQSSLSRSSNTCRAIRSFICSHAYSIGTMCLNTRCPSILELPLRFT